MAKQRGLMSNDKNANLIGIFFLALLVFNFPFLGIFGKNNFVFGIPVLYAYIFVVWFCIIILVFLNFRNKKGE